MKTPLIILLLALVLLAACAPQQVACQADAQACPDGSYVSRVPPSCEFAPCPPPDRTTETNITPVLNTTEPELNITNVTNLTPEGNLSAQACNYNSTRQQYIYNYTERCKTVRYLCTQGKEAFSDNCGCRCKDISTENESLTPPSDNCNYNDTSKRYVQESPDTCRTVLFTCNGRNERPFNDECGCGCTTTPLAENTNTASMEQTPCTDPRPEACTEQYNPACGWFNESIKCVRYPCAQTYSNSCTACKDTKVSNWTSGECPTTF